MKLNGIHLFDEPNKSMLTPLVKLEIVNYIDIIKCKKINLDNHNDLIGYTSGYEFIKMPDDVNAGGYCNWITKEIALSNTDKPLSYIFHELAHTIQDRLGMFNLKETLSYQVKLEQQAETIAYNLYSALVDKNVDYKKFNTYFNIDDIIWLNDYFGGFYENDLFPC